MNSRGADGAGGVKDSESKKRSHDGKLVNGERSLTRVDAPTAAPAVNGSTASSSNRTPPTSFSGPSQPPMAVQLAVLPPELKRLAAESYLPLSEMLLRIGQTCYNDLNETLQKMAEMSVGHSSNGSITNGSYNTANGGPEAQELNKQKKLTMMRFAQENRAKLIKLLVLLEWGKKDSVDIAKLIDVFTWSRLQNDSMGKAQDQIETLKYWTAHTRQPNPDIRTAIEVLATQKAQWIPNVGHST
jgi:mediator of RNA polymerase II transcription subunit 14